jgi:tetratricopeptide (TPR) repeat protein
MGFARHPAAADDMQAVLLALVLLVAVLAAESGRAIAQEPSSRPGAAVELDGPHADRVALRTPAGAVRRAEIDQAIAVRDWDKAERLLVAEIDRAPGSADLLTFLARIFIIDKKPLNAAIAIKKAEAIGPIDDRTRFTLALAYVAMGQREWAIPELERLARSDGSNVIYAYWLARLDYDAGKYASAITRLKGVLAGDPRFVRAHDNLGLCYEAQNQPEQAIAHYREAIRLNREAATKSPWPPFNLGLLLRQRGETKEAEALFREAITYDAGFAQAHYELGTLFEEQSRIDAALGELALAIQANPAYAEPHYARARIYRRQGDSTRADEALATFQRLRNGTSPGRR